MPPATTAEEDEAPADAPPAAPAPAVPPETSSGPPAPGTPPEGAPAAAATPAPPPIEIISGPAVAPPPPPPPQPGFSAIRDVALGIGVPDLVKGRRPVVPPVARMASAGGQVKVGFAVDAAGIVTVQKVDGPELLKEAARHAVASWTFRRTTADRIYLTALFMFEGDAARAEVSPAQ